ncbi:hypothetical protein OEB99_17885 [Actinotalea sp. M2MS4P-6]|uniref:hypothetical protein n=1 Tax=Actinotalea sp. M2MS4P-6 TaxID=2983762 RepID=UPI0021E3BC3D|nr:hypothetical protein [Actinotalea sp. M2MS4P-6]MCV2396185.1 hypothetical protein [Actinotalea sp. M2MS4P-6]
MLTTYTNAIVAIIASALAVLGAATTDGIVTPVEAINIAIAVVTAAEVYLVPNLDTGIRAYAKGIVAFTGAGLGALVVIRADVNGWAAVSLSDWITVALAALGAIGVGALPNKTDVALAA